MIFRITALNDAPVRKRAEQLLPVPPESEGKQLVMMVGTAVVGLLVLFTFLSAGGLCTSLAPWVMLAALRANTQKAGWRWWSGASGAMFFCLGLISLLAPAHAGIASLAGGLLGLLCGLRFLAPVLRG